MVASSGRIRVNGRALRRSALRGSFSVGHKNGHMSFSAGARNEGMLIPPTSSSTFSGNISGFFVLGRFFDFRSEATFHYPLRRCVL